MNDTINENAKRILHAIDDDYRKCNKCGIYFEHKNSVIELCGKCSENLRRYYWGLMERNDADRRNNTFR